MLQINRATYSLSPGPLGVVTASFRPVDEGGARPFVVVAGSFGASLLWTKLNNGNETSDSMTALDGRLGVAAGKTIGGVASPYVLARAFGGPVLWTYQGASSSGTDVYHYQLGAGLVVRSGAFDAVVEGVPLGERAIVAGMGLAF